MEPGIDYNVIFEYKILMAVLLVGLVFYVLDWFKRNSKRP